MSEPTLHMTPYKIPNLNDLQAVKVVVAYCAAHANI